MAHNDLYINKTIVLSMAHNNFRLPDKTVTEF